MGWSKPNLRPWGEFVDTSNMSLPNASTTSSSLSDRIDANLYYFQDNYIVLTVLLHLIVVFYRPLFLFALVFTIVASVYLLEKRRSALFIADRQISRLESIVGLAAVSLLFAVATGGQPFLIAACVSILLVIAHSSVRNVSLRSKSTRFFSSLRKDFSSKSEEDTSEETSAPFDPENPRHGGRGSGSGGSGGSMDDADRLNDERTKLRNQFRASMRAKYGAR